MTALNLLVFREGRQPVHGNDLKEALERELRSLLTCSHPSTGQLTGALLRSGELECAVADGEEGAESPVAGITGCLAQALILGSLPRANGAACIPIDDLQRSLSILGALSFPAMSISAPEGFAYYALHPLAFADVMEKVRPLPRKIAVIGIRTIGTTLSAMATADAVLRGVQAARITVRPLGHPYSRRTDLTPAQKEFIRTNIAAGADFLIVDEGPGLSGSSFLSVAEALLQAGASREKIMLMGSREPDIDALCAPDGPRRWRQFRWLSAASPPRKPAGAEDWLGGGEWRRRLLGGESAWPASWLSFERLKYISAPDSSAPRFFKFAGQGHYGRRIWEREGKTASAGFGPVPVMEEEGFVSYPLVPGRPMEQADISAAVLARLADYCAFRVCTFATQAAHADSLASLQQMADHNAWELRLAMPGRLQWERPVLADGHLQPHEWLLDSSGRMLKTDSGAHGDDHFFPGVTDIAWDLAGAIVEWKMNQAQAQAFLEMYRRASGDHAASRVGDFIKAYKVFRCAYCRMAAGALRGAEEEARLIQAAASYAEGMSLPG